MFDEGFSAGRVLTVGGAMNGRREHVHLTRRERQIMDVLYAREEAPAAEIHKALPDSPSYSAVRALLKKLLDKGHVAFRQDGPRYIYRPVLGKGTARRNALRRLLDTFFDGSRADAVVSLLGGERGNLTDEDLDTIEAELKKIREQKG